MKVKKVLKVISSLLAALVLLLVLLVLFWLGPTVKFLAQSIGSKALGTPVVIESLSISPGKGTIDLNAFTIDTHEGYSRTNTWALASLHISLDMSSLFSDTIVVHEVQIDSPHFTYEHNTANDNIAELIDALQEFSGINPEAPSEKSSKEKEDSGKPPKKVIVEYLVINDVQMHIANTDDPQLDIQLALEQLSLSLTSGVVQLKNLSLSNPSRLDTPNVFELESIDIRLDPASIYSDKVVIKDIQVVKPYAFLEQNPETDTVAEFMKIADSFATNMKAPAETQPTPAPETAQPEAAPPPPVELQNLYVDDIQIKMLDTTGTNTVPGVQTLAAVGGISVKLAEGRLQIQGITIPNPDGFTATNLFHLANIDVSIDPASIFTPHVIITEVLVNSPKINLEQTETNGNVSEFQKILEGFIPPEPKRPDTPGPATVTMTTETSEPLPLSEQPVLLETLLVTNLAVNMILPVDTNTTVMGVVGNLNPLSKVSLGDLNPMKLVNAGATNGVEEIELDENGPVTVVAFNLLRAEPLAGRVVIDQLRVGNPRGFANPNLVSIEQLRIDLDPDSIQSDTLLITNILIDTPRIVYERKLSTDNIKALQSSIEGAAARREGTMPKPEPQEIGTEDAAQKVIIERLYVKNGIVKAKLSALATVPLIPLKFEMTDIGKEEGGATAGDAFSTIYESLYDAIIGSVASVTDFAGDLLKGAGALTFDALGTATGGATDGVKGSLGLDKKSGEADEKKAPVAEEPKKEEKKTRRRLRRPGSHF